MDKSQVGAAWEILAYLAVEDKPVRFEDLASRFSNINKAVLEVYLDRMESLGFINRMIGQNEYRASDGAEVLEIKRKIAELEMTVEDIQIFTRRKQKLEEKIAPFFEDLNKVYQK